MAAGTEHGRAQPDDGPEREISGHIAADDELSRARRLLDQTQEISKTGGWEYDVVAGTRTWTEEVYRIHGVGHDFDLEDTERAIGFYAPEDRPVIARAFTALLETGAPYDLELRFLPLGAAQPIWVRTTARAEMRDGRVVRVVGNLMDIDSHKRAEAALIVERESAQTYLDVVDIFILALRPDGVVTLVNRAACEALGRSEAEILGSDWFELAVPPDVRDSVRAAYEDLIAVGTEPSELFENEVLTAAGERRLVAWRTFVLRDDAGLVTGTLSSGDDITERRATEDALRESESLYRTVVENTSDGIVIGRHQHALFANPAFAAMAGLDPDRIAGFPLISLAQPEEQSEVTDRVQRREAASPGPTQYDTELVRRDDSRISAEVSVHSIQYRGEQAILAVLHDITDRKRAEQEMHFLEVMRDTAEAVARVGSWRWDLATQQASWSPGMYRLFDVDPGTPLGDSLDVLASRVPPDEMKMVREVSARAAATGGGQPIEYHVVLRDGSTRLLRGEATTERDEAGHPVAMVGFYQDITERRAAEEVLRAAEERFRDLFEQSPVPTWEEDFSGVRAWFDEHAEVRDWTRHFDEHPEDLAVCAAEVRVVASNQAGLDLFGAASFEDLTAELDRYFTRESHDVFRQEIVVLTEGGTRFSAEVPIVNPRNQQRLIVELHLGVEAGHEERLDRVLVSFWDVTERRRAEEEVKRLNDELQRHVVSRTEQLDATTRELEALAYSIAHDVRAPLRAIDGFSAAVLEDEADRLSPDGLEALGRVRTATQTLARLLDDLMGLSHVSRRELARQHVDLTALALAVGEETAADHPSRLVTLTVAPGMTAEADPQLVRIILRELLGNAWKFTAPHQTPAVMVGALDGDGERVYYVRDDGVGFDMDYAEHLFGVFQRMHPPGQYEGDGVGLALVQRLVRRHGGRVWAEAAPDAGATIFFTLPPAG